LRTAVQRLSRVWPLFLAELEAHRDWIFQQRRREDEAERAVAASLDDELTGLLAASDPP